MRGERGARQETPGRMRRQVVRCGMMVHRIRGRGAVVVVVALPNPAGVRVVFMVVAVVVAVPRVGVARVHRVLLF